MRNGFVSGKMWFGMCALDDDRIVDEKVEHLVTRNKQKKRCQFRQFSRGIICIEILLGATEQNT